VNDYLEFLTRSLKYNFRSHSIPLVTERNCDPGYE